MNLTTDEAERAATAPAGFARGHGPAVPVLPVPDMAGAQEFALGYLAAGPFANVLRFCQVVRP